MDTSYFDARNARPDIRRLSDGNIAEISTGNASNTTMLTNEAGCGSKSGQMLLDPSSTLCESPSILPISNPPRIEHALELPGTDLSSLQAVRPRLMNHGRSKSVSNRVSFSPGLGASSIPTLSSSSSVQHLKASSHVRSQSSFGSTTPFLGEQTLGSPLARQIESGLRVYQDSMGSALEHRTGYVNEGHGGGNYFMNRDHEETVQGHQSIQMSPYEQTYHQGHASLQDAVQKYQNSVTDLRELRPTSTIVSSGAGSLYPSTTNVTGMDSVTGSQETLTLSRRGSEIKLSQSQSSYQQSVKGGLTWALRPHPHQQPSQGSSSAPKDAGFTPMAVQQVQVTIQGYGAEYEQNDHSRSRIHSRRPSRMLESQPEPEPYHGSDLTHSIMDHDDDDGSTMQRSLSIDSEFESFSYKNVTLLNDVNMEAMMNQGKNVGGTTTGSGSNVVQAMQGQDMNESLPGGISASNSTLGTVGYVASGSPGTLKCMIQSLGVGSSNSSRPISSADAANNVVPSQPPTSEATSKRERERENRREASSGYLFGLGSLARSRSRSRSRASSAATSSHGGASSTPPPLPIPAEGLAMYSGISSNPNSTSPMPSAPPSATVPSSSGHSIFGFGNGSFTKLPGSKSDSKAGSRNGSTTSLTLQSMGPGVISMLMRSNTAGSTGTLTPTKKSSNSSLGVTTPASVAASHHYHQQSLASDDEHGSRAVSRRNSAVGAGSGGEREKTSFTSSPLAMPANTTATPNNNASITPLLLERHDD
ncbi:hypothetical protein BGZ65_004193 [Modicella reniformis]|uniref:Uncharacterized protein n=1 Tax=Modicella reniformis TaxID=1440133 RepID=A0A9P6IYV5_9FUNG|nr:hypothetical protein BGZ65_004193 [Modicella reniformis]